MGRGLSPRIRSVPEIPVISDGGAATRRWRWNAELQRSADVPLCRHIGCASQATPLTAEAESIASYIAESIVVGEQDVGAGRRQVALEAGGLSKRIRSGADLLTSRVVESDLRVEPPGRHCHAPEHPITGSGGEGVGRSEERRVRRGWRCLR